MILFLLSTQRWRLLLKPKDQGRLERTLDSIKKWLHNSMMGVGDASEGVI
jgi:hypothetical protein